MGGRLWGERKRAGSLGLGSGSRCPSESPSPVQPLQSQNCSHQVIARDTHCSLPFSQTRIQPFPHQCALKDTEVPSCLIKPSWTLHSCPVSPKVPQLLLWVVIAKLPRNSSGPSGRMWPSSLNICGPMHVCPLSRQTVQLVSCLARSVCARERTVTPQWVILGQTLGGLELHISTTLTH